MTTCDLTYFVNGSGFAYGDIDPRDVFVEVGTITVDGEFADPMAVLDRAFYLLNRVTEDNYVRLLDERRAPSCSVGDVLVFGETAWVVKGCGFGVVPTDVWAAAVIDDGSADVGETVYALRMAARSGS